MKYYSVRNRSECSSRLQHGWDPKALSETMRHERPQRNVLHLCKTSRQTWQSYVHCNLTDRPMSFSWPVMKGWRGKRQDHVQGQEPQSSEVILHNWAALSLVRRFQDPALSPADTGSRRHTITTLILDHWDGRWTLCSDSCMAEQVTPWESLPQGPPAD